MPWILLSLQTAKQPQPSFSSVLVIIKVRQLMSDSTQAEVKVQLLIPEESCKRSSNQQKSAMEQQMMITP